MIFIDSYSYQSNKIFTENFISVLPILFGELDFVIKNKFANRIYLIKISSPSNII